MNFKSYIGTKVIDAMPMIKTEYCEKHDIQMPENDKEGYELLDSDGCVSWSPKESFEAVYRKSCSMNFGHVLELLKSGAMVARKGWNEKNMFLFLVNGYDWNLDAECFDLWGATKSSFIAMKTADFSVVPWLASQTDLLAEDWEVVDG